MCNVCCKEFQGWCRAFTASEVILSILQAILLTLFIVFLTFLILHFMACSDKTTNITQSETTIPEEGLTVQIINPGATNLANDNETNMYTVPADIACTWTPSGKTKVVAQYFEFADKHMNATNIATSPLVTPPNYEEFLHTANNDGIFISDQFDGKPADIEKSFIMALVKMNPPDDVTFGCILTIISEFWTLTAASCIESIEEVDSLDSFIMMKNFGESRHGRTHIVSDVLVNPQYRGTNKTFDIAALKSKDKLMSENMVMKLPTVLEYLLLTIGERLTILGFGKFRSIERDAFARGVHIVSIHVLPSTQCVANEDAWSARHLTGGVQAARGRCGAASVCAGPLYARGTPCNYCAGTPLLQGRVLLGLMSAPGPCGASCEPAFYVNLAASREWLNSILEVNREMNTGIWICSVLMAVFVVGALAASALQIAAALQTSGGPLPVPVVHEII